GEFSGLLTFSISTASRTATCAVNARSRRSAWLRPFYAIRSISRRSRTSWKRYRACNLRGQLIENCSRRHHIPGTMSESALKFPTDFPIKVMGRHDSNLRELTRDIVERHAGPLNETRIRSRASSDGNFLSVTYVVQATSREQLDAIYRELTAC